MKQTTIVMVVLSLLVVLSAVQAAQLTSLKSQLSEADFSLGKSQGSSRVKLTTGSGGSGSLPASIQDLPTMVGGC